MKPDFSRHSLAHAVRCLVIFAALSPLFAPAHAQNSGAGVDVAVMSAIVAQLKSGDETNHRLAVDALLYFGETAEPNAPDLLATIPANHRERITDLIAKLDAESVDDRRVAARELRQLRQLCVPALPAIMRHRHRDSDATVREILDDVYSFANTPWPSPEIRATVTARQSAVYNLRNGACNELGRLANANVAVPVLLDVLATDAHHVVRESAAKSLEKFPQQAAMIAPSLARALHDRAGNVRLAAAFGLQKFGDHAAAAIPDLIATISGQTEPPAIDAHYANSIAYHAQKALAAIGEPALKPVANVLAMPRETAQLAAMQTLAEFETLPAELAATVVPFIESPSPIMRITAANAIVKLENAADHLANLIAVMHMREARNGIAEALASAGKIAIPAAALGLTDDARALRSACAGVMFRLSQSLDGAEFVPVIPALIFALRDFNPRTTNHAVAVLVKIGEPAIAPTIVALADDAVRNGATSALGSMGTAALEPLAGALFTGATTEIRSAAGVALEIQARGHSQEVGILVPRLAGDGITDDRHDVRLSSVRILGHLGRAATKTLPALDALANDVTANPELVRAARDAAAKIRAAQAD